MDIDQAIYRFTRFPSVLFFARISVLGSLYASRVKLRKEPCLHLPDIR
jgi:hypothetical protein